MKNMLNKLRGTDMRYSKIFFAMFVFAVFFGCSEQDSVLAPTPDNSINVGSKLAKNILSSEPFLVTEKHGGEGKLVYKDGDVKISVKLKFQARSVANDIWITITLDEQDLIGGINLEFGPHGNSFLKPAILDITAEGLSPDLLQGLNSVWYLDEEGNLLEKMNYQKLVVQSQKGAVKLMKAEIPHFSRYGFIRKDGEEEE